MILRKHSNKVVTSDSLLGKKNRLDNDRGVKIVFSCLFALYAFILFVPFVWILLNSFKMGKTEYISANTWALPKNGLDFSNYINVLKLGEINEEFDMANMFFNSILLCIISPTMGIVSTTLAAYVMSKFKFPGKRIVYALFLIPMLISIAGTQTAIMALWGKMGWFNSPYVGITVMSCCGMGMNFFLLCAIFNSTSNTYMEAARIDGAGELRIFGEIMLPHAFGVIGTLWILGFIGSWNDYGTAKLFLEPNYDYTIALGIQKIQEQMSVNDSSAFGMELSNNWPFFFAAIIMSLIPVITIFLIFQKQIMKLSLGGGIK